MMKNSAKMFMAGAAACFAAAGALAGDLPGYEVTPLGDLPGGEFFSRAFDINDAGVIVGSSKDLDDPIRQRAVRWLSGSNVPEALTGLGDFDFSRAQTVNSDGLIGGYRVGVGDEQRAWTWDDVNGLDYFLDDVNDPDIDFSRVSEVTDYGVILGWLRFADLDSGTRGYIYDMGSETYSIVDPIGPDGNQSLARSQNSFSLVTGSASRFPDRDKPFREAVVWSPGFTTPNVLPGLGGFADYEETTGGHVTDDGVIVGGAGNRDAEGTLFAQNENWIWSPSTQLATSMGFLDGYDWTAVGDINDDATFIVGTAYPDGFHKDENIDTHVGAVWTPDTGWVDVNTLIVGGASDYTILELAGMNSYGEVVGTAMNPSGQIEAVLLTPGCLSLSVENLVVGENAMFRVSRGTPGARAAVVAGFGGEPSSFVDVKNWCATFGFDVRMGGRKIRVAFSGIFDDNGVLERERMVRSKLQGLTVLFQAAEQGTCPDECMSNIVQQVVQ